MASIHSTFRSALDRMNEDKDFIYSFATPPVFEWLKQTDPEMLEGVEPVLEVPGYGHGYLVDDVDPKYIDRVWKFYRVAAGETERREYVSRINYWPNMSFMKSANGVVPPFQFGRLRIAPTDPYGLQTTAMLRLLIPGNTRADCPSSISAP